VSDGGAPVPWRTVTLDRDAIVRDDFPAARRGLDPEAVRAHLEAVAGELEDLRAQAASASAAAAAARSAPPSAASAASEHVATIVAAAEQSAAEIERSARDEAARVRADAARESRELVERVRAAAADLQARVTGLDEALLALVERVGAVERAPAPPAEPVAVAPPAVPATSAPAAPAAAPNGAANDADGARLVALNMALSGASREETDRYVAEHYDLPDRSALLDDVFASADA
jgi:cell division septum initiation protein DivIVA